MLQDIERYLACPHCARPLNLDGRTLRCAAGHSFDQAKQGYVSLLAGDAHTGTGDTAEMVAARGDFLAAGHYRPIADALAKAAEVAAAAGQGGDGPTGLVADLGAGTGYYLAHVLDRTGGAGAALDISKFALRRAARAHPRIGALVCDAWRPLPLLDGSADLLLNVFAPRNGPEIRRVLRPGGRMLLVSPTSRHLRELVDALGLLSVDEDKERRTDEKLSPWLTRTDRTEVEFRLRLSHAEANEVVAMGPNAWHTDPARLAAALAELPDPVEVTGSVHLTTYR
ncbi:MULTISPECIES: putative RNA methyltransferase [unclassified Kitasatospora]|uniref:putative RNA methyltransferase n=1 Tax=unclassified Kitasatospora TaxID=2633591 RepID=UPI00070E7173|nr:MULTISPECIES: methyltransferase domain-containing protein [unclassified Kitasatospora]KQV05419.1 23S rRNA methyltransferase [Kitasatospora sp. Root107]KRB62225.1 23S rRNA methyltransferase [Kitasatospora sp. Root187]